MRLLCEHGDRREAQRLADHLLVGSIDTEIREAGHGSGARRSWEVWVCDDDDLPRAHAQLDRFRAGTLEGDPTVRAREIRAARAAADYGWAQRFVMARNRWRSGDVIGPQPFTVALLVASIAVALSTGFGDPAAPLLDVLSIEPWPPVGPFLSHVRAGEWWRLFTPMFIHFGFVHLAFNLWWLYTLGGQIERRHGLGTLVLVVVASELVGSLAQYVFTGPSFGGMSGVNYGLFAFVWMYARFDPERGYTLDDRSVILMVGWFVVCATGAVGPIANFAHAGGLVTGLLLGVRPWLRHLQGKKGELADTPGSWADVSLKGWRRVRRKVLAPYMPLWFLGLAALVITLELLTAGG